MIEAIFQGILLGLVIAFSFGPAFFALINTGIKYGYKSGAALATGIVISDFFCIVIFYLGASALISNPKNQFAVGIIGGSVLIAYGLFNFIKKSKIESENNVVQISGNHYFLIAVKGFFLNLLNPFALLFWEAVVSGVGAKFEFSLPKIVLFFSCALAAIYSTDLLKAFIGNKIKKFLTLNTITIINKISGSVLIVFGIILIYRVLR